MYSIGKTLEEHRSIKSLSVNGSFATIPFCSQLIADIFNKPVGISKNTSSVGLGAFLLSATDMGIYKNLDDAAKSVEFAETFKPNKQNNATYKKYAGIFENLSTKFNAEFEAIANLQQKDI
jgi:gluconokinase